MKESDKKKKLRGSDWSRNWLNSLGWKRKKLKELG